MTPYSCSECSASFIGEPIPDEFREFYGTETHFSRLIGIEDPMVYDGISWWRCPDCGFTWKAHLWSPEPPK